MRGLYYAYLYFNCFHFLFPFSCCWTNAKSSAQVIISNVVDFWIKWIYWFQCYGLWYCLFHVLCILVLVMPSDLHFWLLEARDLSVSFFFLPLPPITLTMNPVMENLTTYCLYVSWQCLLSFHILHYSLWSISNPCIIYADYSLRFQ